MDETRILMYRMDEVEKKIRQIQTDIKEIEFQLTCR